MAMRRYSPLAEGSSRDNRKKARRGRKTSKEDRPWARIVATKKNMQPKLVNKNDSFTLP